MAMIDISNNKSVMDFSYFYFIKARFFAGLFRRAKKEYCLAEN